MNANKEAAFTNLIYKSQYPDFADFSIHLFQTRETHEYITTTNCSGTWHWSTAVCLPPCLLYFGELNIGVSFSINGEQGGGTFRIMSQWRRFHIHVLKSDARSGFHWRKSWRIVWSIFKPRMTTVDAWGYNCLEWAKNKLLMMTSYRSYTRVTHL